MLFALRSNALIFPCLISSGLSALALDSAFLVFFFFLLHGVKKKCSYNNNGDTSLVLADFLVYVGHMQTDNTSP